MVLLQPFSSRHMLDFFTTGVIMARMKYGNNEIPAGFLSLLLNLL